MDVKLIGLDLDRTTLNNKGQISEKTREVLEKVINKGVEVVIATGRSFHSLPEDIYSISGLKYVVTSNGAQIRCLPSGEVIRENYIDRETINELCDYFIKKEKMIEVFVDGKAYIQRYYYEAIERGEILSRAREYVMKTREVVEDIYDFMISNNDKIENINVFFQEDKSKREMFEELKGKKEFTLTSSMPDNLEIGGRTTNKANALEYIANMLNLKREELMCCGDSPNDIAMLRLAEISVAVANSQEEVKKLAKYCTDTNDNEGVAKAIEKFVLKI